MRGILGSFIAIALVLATVGSAQAVSRFELTTVPNPATFGDIIDVTIDLNFDIEDNGGEIVFDSYDLGIFVPSYLSYVDGSALFSAGSASSSAASSIVSNNEILVLEQDDMQPDLTDTDFPAFITLQFIADAVGSGENFALAAGFTEFFDVQGVEIMGGYTVICDEPIVNPIPVPAAVWLLGAGLAGIVGYSRKR